MTIQSMFGVVLWSDTTAQKAVIWCEDQGELAYYTPCERSLHNAPTLDAGDLIQFDLVMQQNMRKATNPQLLEQSHSPNLPNKLRDSQAATVTSKSGGEIVELSQYLGGQSEGRLAGLG